MIFSWTKNGIVIDAMFDMSVRTVSGGIVMKINFLCSILFLSLILIFNNSMAAEDLNDQFKQDIKNIEATTILGKWVVEDQALRNGLEVINKKNYPEIQLNKYYKKISDVDKRNTENLKIFLDNYGWPVISKYSSYGDFSAFILCLHADHDRVFQKRCLSLVEKAFETSDTNPSNLALLTDRVLVGEGKKQKFGSQGECQGSNNWEPHPIENPEQVDDLRKKYSLEPLEAYKRRMNTFCL